MPTSPILLRDLIASNEQAAQLVEPTRGPTSVVFFDFFFSDNLGRPGNNLNNFIQWDVRNGSVDLVGGVGPGVFGAPPDQSTGRYVDLGGSTSDPGEFETKLSFPVVAGQTYNLTFDYRSTDGKLATGTGTAGGESFTVSSGSTNFRTFSQDFVADATGAFSVKFQGLEADRDNGGLGIDGILFGQVVPAEDSIQFSGDFGTTMIGRNGADQLFGEGGNDILNGGLGADRMAGGAGNDTFYIDNAGDRVLEVAGTAGGADTVLTSTSYTLRAGVAVETFAAADPNTTAVLNFAGNEFAQTMRGSKGVNILTGGGGNDSLAGGLGSDTFFFNAALNETTNVDLIRDFANTVTNNDTIRLENAIFTELADTGRLATALFVANVDGEATSADQRIVFETDTGKLFYDADGAGGAAGVQFATITNFASLTGTAALSAADFYVV